LPVLRRVHVIVLHAGNIFAWCAVHAGNHTLRRWTIRVIRPIRKIRSSVRFPPPQGLEEFPLDAIAIRMLSFA